MKIYSIIVPTFNSAHTLKRCLDSILSQTFKNFEIIIADGLSTDSTLMTAESMRDERINIFSEKDYGVYDAMNNAVERAQGKWILFLGSDDFLFDDFVLEKMSETLGKSNADFVYGDVRIVGKTSWASDGEIYRGEFSTSLLMQFNICHQCIFYNRLVFKTRKYNIDYSVCADYDFNLYCASKYLMEYHPIIIANFNAGGISTTSNDPKFEREKWLNIIVYFKEKLLDRKFVKYRTEIKKTISVFVKRSEIENAISAIRIYCYLLLKKRLKTLNN